MSKEDQILEKLSGPRICRKTSPKKTKECPVFNYYNGWWEESDANFRARLKKIIIGGNEHEYKSTGN
jgi:hypothetical protein